MQELYKQQYAEQFGRMIEQNEIVIEFDNCPLSWEAVNNTCWALVQSGYNIQLWYAQGQKCPHIHLKNFNVRLIPAYKKTFMKKYIPSEFQQFADFQLCSTHRIAEENKPHFKYGTEKKLIGFWNEGKENKIDLDLMQEALKEQKEIMKERNIAVQGSGITAEIVKKISIIQLAKDYGLKVRGNMAVCPFHNDSNPSLSFNDAKGWFHCFGCDKKGNIIKFTALMERLKNGRAD
jgi:hypothetical protein